MTTTVAVPAVSPFDIPSIQRSITSAIATLPKDKLGQLVLDVKKDRASAALMVRMGSHVEMVAWVTKPYVGDLDYGLQGRVSFLAGAKPKRVLFARLRGWYRVFRADFMGEPLNDRDLAAWKALKAWLGFRVRMVG